MKILATTVTILLIQVNVFSQNTTVTDTAHPSTATVIAGKEYSKGSFGRLLWGAHYRDIWTMPVKVPKLRLDTAFGGLKPVEKGGGKQTKNLRLDAPDKRQYAIRSINKDYGKALPEVVQGTFIESIIKDQMSVAQPYGAITITPLADAAKVYSTRPHIVFIGDDAALGKYREEFRNELYSLEDRPSDKNAGFYGAKDVLDTEEFLEKILSGNNHRADAAVFARARLFDMLIGDWDRHDDQWKWAEHEENGIHIYRAMPKDRDQAYSKFDGLLVQMGAKAAQLPYLQGFKPDIRNIQGFNLEARPLDMQLLNGLTLDDWKNIAADMQRSLTDAVIENAVKLLPPEVYAVTGAEMISVLKSRRDHLVDFAERYYRDLSKEVDIAASEKTELVEVNGIDEDHLSVSIYNLDKNGTRHPQPFYSRTFSSDETDEVRIYGIGGNDRFVAKGAAGRRMKVRFIGGPGKDDYVAEPSFSRRLRIYDDADNNFNTARAEKFISSDSAVHDYDRKGFRKSSSGIMPRLGYNNEDRIFVGLGYRVKKQQFRKTPFGYTNDFSVKYSIDQKAFSFIYKGIFNQALGKWNLGALAEYDQVRDAYFMGIGNNAVKLDTQRRYYLYRNKEANAGLSVYRMFDSAHTITFAGYYQMVQLLNDPGSYLSQYFIPGHAGSLDAKNFAGIRLTYDFTKVNDKTVPNKGLRFTAGAEHTRNLQNSNDVTRFSGLFGFYLPLGPFTLAVKTAAATLTGAPEFYQLNKIGGGPTLRGFTRFRFYGKSMFINQNELQWNFNVKTYLFSGKMGLIALFDNGRVWNPGETSDQWHSAVGGGLMIAPFNMISVTGFYAVSQEDQRIGLRVGHFLKR